MVDRPINPTVDIFGQEEENTISYGLLRSAVEMGDAVTEAGAVSAAAAFFRQNLDACAWAEEPTPPPPGTTAASPGAPPLLKFPLHSKVFKSAVGATHSSDSEGVAARPASSRGAGEAAATAAAAAAAAPLELVVSRGPGPIFSEHEIRVARYAALLLSQALARIRDRAALSEARSALEDSFRGMQEASDAVAVLVEERERRSRLEARQGADLEDKHKKEVSAAERALERARREGEQLRGKLDAAGESLAAVSEAAGDVCRAVAAACCDPGDDAAETGEGSLSDEEARREVVAVVERAARTALRCSSARVAEGANGIGGSPPSDGTNGYFADDHAGDGEMRSSARRGSDNGTDAVEQLHVPIPYLDSGVAGSPLVLSVHGASSPRQRFTGRDRAAASSLATCLSTALLALRENKARRRVLREVEADHQAAAIAEASAEAEAQERGERAVAGMRSLVAAAHVSRAQAEAAVSAARRAERHTDALGHFLSGLGEARSDHAAVARVVHRQAGAVVPGCVGAVLLTPRRDGKGAGTSLSFSPDPRAWATAAAQRKGSQAVRHGSEKNGRRSKAYGRQWAKRVERAAVRAATAGKAVCVTSGNAAGVSAVGSAGVGDGGADVGRSRVVCFSPVLGGPSSQREGHVVDADANGRPLSSSASVCSNRMRTTELEGGGAISGGAQAPCLIAWMVFLGGSGEVRGVGNNEETSGAPWAAVSPLTDENVSSDPAVAEPLPPAPPPLLPPRVTAAMEAVVHAVDLALHSGAAAAAAGAPTHRQPERSNARSNNNRGQGAEDAASEELERSRRDEELRRLRDGTAALAERVRTLEGRAAGLRASEARSAAALARARADAGAVRGELQLATLELERARRQPLAARSVGNSSPRRGGGSGGLSGAAFRPYWAPSNRAVGSIGSQLCGLAGNSSGGRNRSGEGGGPGVPATPLEASSGEKGEKAAQQPFSSRAAFASTVLPGSSSLSPPLADASSAALQHMASVHARLSSSLKSGRLSRATPREGPGPVLLGVV